MAEAMIKYGVKKDFVMRKLKLDKSGKKVKKSLKKLLGTHRKLNQTKSANA